jgi:hypothetical protein
MGGISIITSLDDDNNSVKIRVMDWDAVVAKARCVFDMPAGAFIPVGSLIFPHNSEVPPSSSSSSEEEEEAPDTGVLRASENTISVTGKGSVIVRLSWGNALPWDKEVEASILESCRHLCVVLKECC